MNRLGEDIFLIESILNGITVVRKSPEKSRKWDISLTFSSAIMPKLFGIFTEYGVQATIMEAGTGKPVNIKPFALLTKRIAEERLDLCFSTEITLGKKAFRSKININPGDRIIFSLNGTIIREFNIFPSEDKL